MDLMRQRSGRPSTVVDSLRNEFNQLFDRLWSGQLEPVQFGRWAPAADVSETPDAVLVKIEIPGIDPKDIEVSLEESVLTIKGEKCEPAQDVDENFHRVERQYGAFTRHIPLPARVDAEKVEAVGRNGVLEITLAKHADARPKRVEVNVE